MAEQLPPIPREPIGETFSWRDWFSKIQQIIPATGSILWSAISFTGSNLRDIATRQHNALQDIQGGTTDQYYHLNQTQLQFVQDLDGGVASITANVSLTNTTSPTAGTLVGYVIINIGGTNYKIPYYNL